MIATRQATFASCFLGFINSEFTKRGKQMKNIISVSEGQRFGKLTVIREAERQYGHRYILCQCDCGNQKTINLNSLIHGASNSCGCFRKEFIANKNFKHGFAYRENGLERLYRIWSGMKRRCFDSNFRDYNNYGGRGISVCNEWKENYSVFREWALSNGYSDKLTLDRIDNNGNYEPSNCRWTTIQIQSNNKRVNRRITYKGETHTIADWGRITGIDADKIGKRLKKGLPLEQVFFNGNLKHYKEMKK